MQGHTARIAPKGETMKTKIEWVCTKCMWEGASDDTNNYRCPECGAEIERPTDAPIWEHFHGYNWNKK